MGAPHAALLAPPGGRSGLDVYAHNVETVERLQKTVGRSTRTRTRTPHARTTCARSPRTPAVATVCARRARLERRCVTGARATPSRSGCWSTRSGSNRTS
eukprot:6969791-Prymnesium_polylepis.1